MLRTLLFKKSEIGNLQVNSLKPFELTPEKITQTPRSFNTEQIKIALENLSFKTNSGIETLPDYFKEIPNYLLKNFFLKMHQTGLYNRQINLWKTLGTISEASFYRLNKRFLKKDEDSINLIDFSTSSKKTCICALILQNKSIDYKFLKFQISIVCELFRKRNLKGIFFLLENLKKHDALKNFELLTNLDDQISKYESVIKGTKDIRMNVINIKQDGNNYTFEHIYPQIKQPT